MSIIDKRPLNRAERRKQATRIKLLEATIQILAERGYQKFSIKAVTELADVGYGTFYLHFANQDDVIWLVLLHQFEQTQAEVEALVANLDNPERELMSWRIFFENIKQRQDDYNELFGEDGSVVLRYKLEQYTAEVYLRNIEAGKYTMPSAYVGLPEDYLAHFMAGAQLQLVRWWLASDMSYTSEDLAIMLYRTIYHEDPT